MGNFLKYITSTILLLTFLTACAPSRKNRKQPSPSQSASPSACELTRQYYESGAIRLYVENKITVPIKRVRQRRIVYNCQGKKIKDKVETIQSPREDFIVSPHYKMEKVKGVELFNLDTCTIHSNILPLWNVPLFGLLLAVTGDDSGKIRIKADMAPALLTFRVKNGMNRIYYTYFEKCIPGGSSSGGSGVCEDPGQTYSGIYNVEINYADETIPGIQEVRAECNPQR